MEQPRPLLLTAWVDDDAGAAPAFRARCIEVDTDASHMFGAVRDLVDFVETWCSEIVVDHTENPGG